MDISTTDITADELRRVRRRAGLTTEAAADLAGVHRTTYQRQEAGKARPHLAIYRLFLTRCGHLADPAWSGWRLQGGRLVSPDNLEVTPGEVNALPWLFMLANEKARQAAGSRVQALPVRPYAVR